MTHLLRLWLTLLIFLLTIASCNHSNSSSCESKLLLTTTYQDIKYKYLVPVDTLISYDKEMPVALDILNDKLFILFPKDSILLNIVNTNNGQLLYRGCRRGVGPQDLHSLSFFRNGPIPTDTLIKLYDLNYHKLVVINNELEMTIKDMPEILIGEGSMNMANGFAVGTPLQADGTFITIIDIVEDTLKCIKPPYRLSVSGESAAQSIPMFLAPNINASINHNKIIASMYYFDIFYVFDFTGKCIRTVSLGTEEFSYEEAMQKYLHLNSDGYIRYVPGYSNETACYLRRLLEIPKDTHDGYDHKASEIVEVSWDGDVKAIYPLPEGAQAFCTDYKGNFYVISREIVDMNELYRIIRYRESTPL